MRRRPIQIRPHTSNTELKSVIEGWLGKNGAETYLWLGVELPNGESVCTGILDGARLYRLAKAIVRRFEGE